MNSRMEIFAMNDRDKATVRNPTPEDEIRTLKLIILSMQKRVDVMEEELKLIRRQVGRVYK